MKKDNVDYASWISALVKECLPLDLQTKLLKLQPLSHQEVTKFINVILLASQARVLSDHHEMMNQLRNIVRR